MRFFAVVYALIYRGELPTVTMVVGFIILMAGVLGSLRVFRQPLEEKPAKINIKLDARYAGKKMAVAAVRQRA